MDNYIGYKLLFNTVKGTMSGVLRGWDDIQEQVTIERDNMVEIIDILDINDLEILECCDNETPECIDDDVAHEICLTHKQDEQMPSKLQVAKSDLDSNVATENDGVTTKSTSTIDLEDCLISEQVYVKMINDCFNIYGPSKDEFINTVSTALLKLFKKHNKTDLSVCIVLGKNSLYNCIGYHLGRILSVRNFAINICTSEDRNIDVFKYKYYFSNSHSKTTRDMYDVCLCLDGKQTDIKATEYYYLNKGHDGMPNSVWISLGCVFKGCTAPGKWYLVDMNISQDVYELYGLRRIFVDSYMVKLQ